MRNPQKSGASQVCITFPQITQKILTKDIFHLLEVITEILNFLQIFSVRKITTYFFNISKNLQENRQKNDIPGIFWAFKSKLQIILAATYIALFLPDTHNCFFICIIPYIHICFYYFLIFCFYFHLLFVTLLATKHILQFTMVHIISLQTALNITEIKNTS